ncbi:hypothetical protein [Polaribacter aestuariivivens]|uniref:hypothetical protein n=1 Tax=Polaribacter aestuariivivens TaxID=2304626 RepID=UPI003F498763
MIGYKKAILLLITIVLFFSCGVKNLNSISENDYIFKEAEQTNSDLQKWNVVKRENQHFVKGASEGAYLEFMGNKPITGKPNSPLEYKFIAPKTGNFKLMLMTSKRLEGVKSDWCNDAFVKLSGNFESASKLTTETLKKNIKILQDGNDETAELEWHWASTAEKDRHVYNDFVYQLKKGEKYTLTLSGRSMRFSVDYIVLYDTSKFSFKKAKKIFKK